METLKMPLSQAKQNTKQANKSEKQKLKKINDQLKQSKLTIKNNWLEDTQSVSALVKYVRKNTEIVKPLIDAINKKYDVNFNVGSLNASVLKFGYLHELNQVNLDGEIIKPKKYFNISFMLKCLERKAKFDSDLDKFAPVSKKATEKNLLRKYSNIIHKTSLIFGDDVHTFVDQLIDQDKTMQQIVNRVKTEFKTPQLNK